MAIVRRSGPGTKASASGWPPADSFTQDYPDLASFLGDNVYPDGAARITGTLLVFVEDGVPKVCLSDRDADLVCFLAGPALGDLLRLAEQAVSGGAGDWRAKRGQASTPSNRPKRG